MTIVYFCIYCDERVDIINGEFVTVAEKWEDNPAKYAHPDCHQEEMRKVEKDE